MMATNKRRRYKAVTKRGMQDAIGTQRTTKNVIVSLAISPDDVTTTSTKDGTKTIPMAKNSPAAGGATAERSYRKDYTLTEQEKMLLELLALDDDPPRNFLTICRRYRIQSNQVYAWLGKALLYRRTSLVKAMQEYWGRRPGMVDYDAPEKGTLGKRDLEQVQRILSKAGLSLEDTLAPGVLANALGLPVTSTKTKPGSKRSADGNKRN
jgi:hypothetical protein